VSSLSVDEKLSLALSVCEECIQEQELRALFEHKLHPIVYDGFEPSGRMHIAQGILRSVNVNKLTSCGCVFKFWVADWFAQLNNKMGGDLNKIRIVGRYMIEIWKAAGMNMQNVRFYWASEEINKRPNEYWSRVMEIARLNNVSRIQRCCTIMGRQEAGDMSSAQIFYPCMQCADVFFLKADICQLGMDQRKVNMLAREYCDQTKPKIKFKPVILSHHMLLGMKEGQEKMSKTEPDSAIFMEDSAQVVASKIKKAFCPPGVVEGNPVIDYIKYIVFAKFGYINITPLDGEEITYTNYEEFEREYINERIHPKEAKEALTLALNEMLEPVRVHFASGEPAKLLAKVSAFKITR
jgi:tyrosyl-tRNA synthetase